MGDEKIMILINRKGKSDKKDKVKDINKVVFVGFIVYSLEYIVIKSFYK